MAFPRAGTHEPGRHGPGSLLYLDEVFLSLQGEGGELGKPQVFLRLAGCPLRCKYCDTPRSWKKTPHFHYHGRHEEERIANPISGNALSGLLERLAAEHKISLSELTLSVTGGEPLEQTEFLENWLPTWPGKVLLETAGIMPQALERILPHLDYVSLDWKLESTLRSGKKALQPEDCAFRFYQSGTEGWIKVVVCEDTTTAELELALQRLSACAPGVRTYLQPSTPFEGGAQAPTPERLLQWALQFRHLPLDLRVQPQMHPIMGVR